MTTVALDATVSRTGYHRHWSVAGTTWPTGETHLDAEVLHFLFDDGGDLIAANYTGDEFGYLHGDDDAGDYRYRLRIDDSDGTHTEDDDYTHTPPTFAHNIYVDPAAADDTAAGTEGDPYKTASAGATALRALGSGAANRKLWLKANAAHAVSSALASANTDGLFAIGAYGGAAGDQAEVDLASNASLIYGIGAHDATGQFAVDIRDLLIDGAGGTDAAVFEWVTDGDNASPVSYSSSFKNLDIDGVFIGSRMATVNGGLSDAEISAGHGDFIAFEDVHFSNLVSYGTYGSGASRKLLRKNVSYTTGTNGGTGSAIRWYNAAHVFQDLESVSDTAADAIRWLSTTGTHHTADHNRCRVSAWDVTIYVEHNVATEGGDTTENIFERIKCHSYYASGTYFEWGGNRQSISIRSCMFRQTSISLAAETGTNNNLVNDFRTCCNSLHRSGIGGGDAFGTNWITGNSSNSGFQDAYNAVYVTGTGTVDWGSTDTGSSSPAFFALSDYNFVLSSGVTTRWRRNFTGGNDTLGAWQGATVHDDNSGSTGTTHGFTTLGTADTNDWDLHLSAAASTFKDAGGTTYPLGLRLDYEHHVRTTTNGDVGAHDFAATDPPTEPELGGDEVLVEPDAFAVEITLAAPTVPVVVTPTAFSVAITMATPTVAVDELLGTTIEFSAVNGAAVERTETVRVSIPFASGFIEESDLAGLTVSGKSTVWLPMQYWADGTIKVAQAQFTDTLPASTRVDYEIADGPALSGSFEQHAWVASLIGGLQFGAEVRDAFGVRYRSMVSGAAAGETLQSTSLVRVKRHRVYHESIDGPGIGRDFLTSTFYVTEFKDSPHVVVDWILGNDYLGADDPAGSTDPNLYPLGAIGVTAAFFVAYGATAIAPYRAAKEGIGVAIPQSPNGSAFHVIGSDFIGDGQTRRYRFVLSLVPPDADPGDAAAAADTLSAMQTAPLFPLASQAAWEISAAAGIVGGPIAGGSNAATIAANELAAWEATGHFGTWGSRGDPKNTETTGTPRNHPLSPPWAHAIQGDYHGQLVQLEQMAWAQAMRPYHLFGLDLAAESEVVLWTGMPFLAVANTETLGRRALNDSDPYGVYRTLGVGTEEAVGPGTHDWQGYDHEHFTTDLLFDYWTATGDAWAKEELRQLGQSLKALKKNHGQHFTNGINSVRAEGWCMQGFVQCYLATQAEDVKEYAITRLHDVIDVHREADRALWFQESHPATLYPNPHEFFMPWQHGGVLFGFLGAHTFFGDALFLEIAETVVDTVAYSWVTDIEHPTFGSVAQGLRYYVPATFNGVSVTASHFDGTVGVHLGDSPLGGAHGFLIAGLFLVSNATADEGIRANARYYGELLRGPLATIDRSYKWNYCLPQTLVPGGGEPDPVLVTPAAFRVDISLAVPTIVTGEPDPGGGTSVLVTPAEFRLLVSLATPTVTGPVAEPVVVIPTAFAVTVRLERPTIANGELPTGSGVGMPHVRRRQRQRLSLRLGLGL